jgi:hypothetical protein
MEEELRYADHKRNPNAIVVYCSEYNKNKHINYMKELGGRWQSKVYGGGSGWTIPKKCLYEVIDYIEQVKVDKEIEKITSHVRSSKEPRKYHRAVSESEDSSDSEIEQDKDTLLSEEEDDNEEKDSNDDKEEENDIITHYKNFSKDTKQFQQLHKRYNSSPTLEDESETDEESDEDSEDDYYTQIKPDAENNFGDLFNMIKDIQRKVYKLELSKK